MQKKIFILILCFYIFLLFSGISSAATQPSVVLINNQTFRDDVINFVRDVAMHITPSSAGQKLDDLNASWNNVYQKTDWTVNISAFRHGEKTGEGKAKGSSLTAALKKAAEASLQGKTLSSKVLSDYRFKVTFNYYPSRTYAFIEFNNKGLELTGNRVAIRKVDKQALSQQIINSQHYLLKTMHPQYHGFFKFYDAAKDHQEDLLRTIYSSSSLYTLLKLYQLNQDPELLPYFKPIADFILSNQAQNGPNAGGFYYGYNPKTKKKSCKIVVGTTSKTIFTLIELNRIFPKEPKYLQAAQKAGDWLVTRVKPDGKVLAIANCESGHWKNNTRQSFLYSGQVLSALSRLYGLTHDERYHKAAILIAQHFLNELKRQGNIVGDEYRPGNSISSSWVLMSFIDLAKVDADPIYRKTIDKLASTLLSRQITNKADIFSNGRYLDAMTTSGNGWINEVIGVLNEFCMQNKASDCQKYSKAMLLTSRWLLQNAYTLENTYNVKNPQRAIGGFITNFNTQTVRTDAVCHGLNSIIMIVKHLDQNNHILVNLPETPFVELLPLLRAGDGGLTE